MRETEGGKFFEKLKVTTVDCCEVGVVIDGIKFDCYSKIDSLSIFHKHACFAAMDGNVYGLAKRLDSLHGTGNPKAIKLVKFDGAGLELTAVELYHGNIIAVMFNLSSRKACLKLLNLKTKMESEAAIKKQDRPTQKILMFVRS